MVARREPAAVVLKAMEVMTGRFPRCVSAARGRRGPGTVPMELQGGCRGGGSRQ
jgi:hypothetical protein